MAITKGDNGRVIGDSIVINGEYIQIEQFAKNMGFGSWEEYVQVNPVNRGLVSVDLEKFSPASSTSTDANIPSNTQVVPEGVNRLPIAPPSGFTEFAGRFDGQSNRPLFVQPQRSIDDGFIPSRFIADQSGRPQDAIIVRGGRGLPAPASAGRTPGQPPDRTLPFEPTPEPQRQLFTPSGSVIPAGLDTSGDVVRAAFVASSRRDAIAGGNITDIYQNYLPSGE